jgi:DNA-binding NtrC family response regulator
MRVVVADDHDEIREVIGEYLADHGMDVIQAANGLEALLQIKRMRPAALVLDLRMPRLGGLEALKRIRVFDPAMIVVVVTGEIDPALHRQALDLGARTVLTKPIALPTLLAALRGGPVPSAPTPDEPRAAATSMAAPDGARAPRVLLVDDDAGVRATLAEALTMRGYHVTEASDAASGVRSVVEAKPDVILLDITMPGLSGAAALPAIRALAGRTAIIMISGTADEEMAKRTLALGAFDYLMKPVDFDYLARSVETALAMNALDA